MEKQETQIDNLKLNKQQEKKPSSRSTNATDTVLNKNENDPNKQKRNKKPEMVRYQPPNSRLSKSATSDTPTPVVNKIDEIEEKVMLSN